MGRQLDREVAKVVLEEEYGRRVFTERFIELLGTKGVPSALRVAWNDQLDRLLD